MYRLNTALLIESVKRPPAGGGAAVIWTVTYESIITANYWQRFQVRIPLTPSQSVTEARFQLRGAPDGVLPIADASIGERSGTTDDFAVAPTRITFGGNNGYTIAISEEVWSDWITVTLDPAKEYLVHLHGLDGGFIRWYKYRRFGNTNYYLAGGSTNYSFTESVAFNADTGQGSYNLYQIEGR